MKTFSFPNFANSEIEITLDNVPIIINKKWNSRGQFWVLSFSDRDRNLLLSGVKAVLSYELIKWYPDRGLPPGQLFLVDPTGNTDRPGREDFENGRLSFTYIEEGEFATV